MRKKIMALFYTLASVLVVIQLGTRLKQINHSQSSSEPLYVVSQNTDQAEAEVTDQELQSIDYSKWSNAYDGNRQ